MTLTRGTRLGVYDILNQIGAGGMGEVYRARDTKLDRDVAIKVLPDFFAHDPGRLARFERAPGTWPRRRSYSPARRADSHRRLWRCT